MADTERPNHLVAGFHSRGVLPHLKREGGTYFVTFRQAGTLPKEILLRFKEERDSIIQQAMAATLRAKGHSVLCAANGSDALQLTDIHAPSLVILDLQMPVLDGRGFVQGLRRRGHELPILVITGGLEAARAVDEMGAIGYLEKPFRLGELLHAVSQFGPTPDAATHTPL